MTHRSWPPCVSLSARKSPSNLNVMSTYEAKDTMSACAMRDLVLYVSLTLFSTTAPVTITSPGSDVVSRTRSAHRSSRTLLSTWWPSRPRLHWDDFIAAQFHRECTLHINDRHIAHHHIAHKLLASNPASLLKILARNFSHAKFTPALITQDVLLPDNHRVRPKQVDLHRHPNPGLVWSPSVAIHLFAETVEVEVLPFTSCDDESRLGSGAHCSRTSITGMETLQFVAVLVVLQAIKPRPCREITVLRDVEGFARGHWGALHSATMRDASRSSAPEASGYRTPEQRGKTACQKVRRDSWVPTPDASGVGPQNILWQFAEFTPRLSWRTWRVLLGTPEILPFLDDSDGIDLFTGSRKTKSQRTRAAFTSARRLSGEQGDPLMPLLFSIGVQVEEVTTALLPGEQLRAFLNDVHLFCEPSRVKEFYVLLADALIRVVWIHLHQGKTRAWNRGGIPSKKSRTWGRSVAIWGITVLHTYRVGTICLWEMDQHKG